MIPCHICGKDASTGWTKGFIPAPDSQKMALCAEHDTPKNRLLVSRAWRDVNAREIAAVTSVARHKASPALHVVSVHFTGGGMLSFTCTACTPAATRPWTACGHWPMRNGCATAHWGWSG